MKLIKNKINPELPEPHLEEEQVLLDKEVIEDSEISSNIDKDVLSYLEGISQGGAFNQVLPMMVNALKVNKNINVNKYLYRLI